MKKITLLLFVIVPAITNAQSFVSNGQERSLLISAGVGTSSYYGELTNQGQLMPNAKPTINVGVQAFLSNRISVRGELNWFQLHGDDNKANSTARKARGLSFVSNGIELSTTGTVSLLANGNRYYRRPIFNIYGFVGIGLLYFNPTANYKGKSYSLEPLHTGGVSYSRFTPVIPVGLGARIKLAPNYNLVIEGGYRKTFTDYLDDVSGRYIAPTGDAVRDYFINPTNTTYNPAASSLPADEQNQYHAGSKRGDPTHKDGYFLLNVKIEYYLPVAKKYNKYKKSYGLGKGGMFKAKKSYYRGRR